MKTFLQEVTADLYAKHGDDISSLTIVFPNRRATRFFARDLAQVIERPIWQPRFASIDDLVREVTGLETAHELTLVARLYEVYNRHLPEAREDFDKFYTWGRLLLADFDTIDKYLIDARLLYSNMSDLRELETLLGEEFEERELILNFWRNIGGSKREPSKHFSTFLNIWERLFDIYTEFREVLQAEGVGYSGMVYRQASELFASGAATTEGEYVFVGFNALNRCEELILRTLKERGQASFYWDGDSYYVSDRVQEAGLFLRRNIERFSPDYVAPRNFAMSKNMEVVKSPNDIMQCKALQMKLREILQTQGYIESETAVVLTDEALLPVVLYSIPPEIEDINVTMGAALTQSAPYVFFERLTALQRGRKEGGYYFESVLLLLQHPYIQSICKQEANNIVNFLRTTGHIYISGKEFENFTLLKSLFPSEHLEAVNEIDYYTTNLRRFAHRPQSDDPAAVDNNEFALSLIDNLLQTREIILKSGLQVSQSILHSLLGKINNNSRIPYDGDPLQGIQVMGILESRCLDFKNVILLSMCDETFPGNRPANTFIPANLRKGFGLPTQTEHGAMWAYYFYRLISRAQNVTMMYSAARDNNASGEQSRYIYQLEYESPHKLLKVGVDLNISPENSEKHITIEKTAETVEMLKNIRYSPSAINNYIDCPLRFYMSRIAKVKPQEELQADVQPNESGSILHHAIELLYKPILDKPLHVAGLDKIIADKERINEAIDQAINHTLKARATMPELQGSLSHLRKLLAQQITAIISLDMQDPELESICGLEQELVMQLPVGNQTITIKGFADRIDRLLDGNKRIIDYKTGATDHSFESIEALFTNTNLQKEGYKKHNHAALQTLIYSLANQNAAAGLYSLKRFNDPKFSPYITNKETGETLRECDQQTATQVRERLTLLFEEILDPATPFHQSPHTKDCEFCDYQSVCAREV